MKQNPLFKGSQSKNTQTGPVKCLGMTFENDEERRKYFLDILGEKLKDPEFRKIEGFPIGSDDAILALSDPPYYTACPNPFIADFIKQNGKPYDPSEPYTREPFAVDVSEGKNDPIYRAHSYHTKVPHFAIVPSILHYTEPGDVVLDGFCGSGMTGVAAQWSGSASEDYKRKIEGEFANQGIEKPKWGTRSVVLNDLGPAATFIAANYNLPFDVQEFARAGKKILDEVEEEIGWMYRTVHSYMKDTEEDRDEILKVLFGESSCPSWIKLGHIEYTVWSEVFNCPDCAGEVVFLNEALDEETKRVKDTFPCPHCGIELTKQRLERNYETRFDSVLRRPVQTPKRKPALIVYSINSKRQEKIPDEFDLSLLERIAALDWQPEVPSVEIPPMHMTHERARMDRHGVTHIHHFFMPRASHALATLWRKANAHPNIRVRHMLLFFVEQAITSLNIQNRYGPHRYSQSNGAMPLVYYVPSQISEVSPWYILGGKLKRLCKSWASPFTVLGSSLIQTGTMARLFLPTNCIDYIFTDPPFGENIYYADLNFLVESWHRVITNAEPEAIVDRFKKKGMPEYQHLMQRCFEEYYRVLKPGRWMTVVFHNSRNAVWNAIQEGMQVAGFVVADVRMLDKQTDSYRQVTSTAVKQDLIISAYKPNDELEKRFKLRAGTEEGVWDFIQTHLKQLPVFVFKESQAEVISERQNYLLFDRMVAFHVLRGVTVPLSAAEFSAGLIQRFSERDGMFFLPEQVAEYDKKRINVREVLQLQLFVIDESTAIQWLRQQLLRKPQTASELKPLFMKEIGGWQKNEKMLELDDILEQNFLRYFGKSEVPNQIHSYLSSNFKELRNLPKDDESLRAKGKDRWCVPDPNKAGDLEKLRERALLKEFWEYLPPGYQPPKVAKTQINLPGLDKLGEKMPKAKKMKIVRLEAVRAGFKLCWQNRDYRTIIIVAKRIPENVLQEDPKLLMWYDQAVTRLGEDE
ncbi:DNA methyltransferase [Acidobacteriota bacterium]